MINSSAILEIDIKNFLYNYKSLAKIANNSLTGATIKANAYGLGDIKVFKILYKAGCRHFFVANIQEALNIRKKYIGGFIYVLNGLNKKNIKYLFKEINIIPIINSIENLKEIQKEIIKKKKNIKNINVGIHIDTGINRLGISINELNKLSNNKNIKITLVMSHLASADEKYNSYNNKQLKIFNKITDKYFKYNLKSISNSAGIILGDDFHYDIVRPGIALYGGHNNTNLKNKIKPVIKLKAEILQIKKIYKNNYVGYNQTYV